MSLPPIFPGTPAGGPRIDPKRLHDHWGAIVIFGAGAAVLGALALILTESATITSVLIIGVFMVLTGATEIAVGFRMRSWGRFIAWEIAGVVYVLAGGFAILVPEVASVVITLLLGAGLMATGILRIVFGVQTNAANRSILLVSGVVTALLGLLVVLGWPGNSALVLGTLLGIDLLFNGLAWIAFGLRARSAA